MFFEIKRVLGFSRAEWRNLSWIDKQMYTEELANYQYREAYSNWKEQPANKRGPEPQKPDFKRIREDAMPEEPKQGINGNDPDIETVEGMDIQSV